LIVVPLPGVLARHHPRAVTPIVKISALGKSDRSSFACEEVQQILYSGVSPIMLKSIRQLWVPKQQRPLPAVPPGERVYAIGDIHGRLDLFAALIRAIEQDDAARERAEVTVVLLGDLIDRGPHSAGVLKAVRLWQGVRDIRIVCGNHEEMFLASFDNLNTFRGFMQYGGRETVMSYLADVEAFLSADFEEAQTMMNEIVPREDIEFIAGFEDFVLIGDYLFVHAGVRPGQPLMEQNLQEMRWIREPFLSHSGWHEHMVVHGHTISDEPEITHNRIGIDTGAYHSGRLTALALEADRRWLIEAQEQKGAITVTTREI
jgi:serine/threonine protein phosphatase 1